jgi:ubiquinone biosynthesis monooxygenase Coq6
VSNTCLSALLLLPQVWEFAGPSFISWASSEVGLPHMGCVVENRLLQAALLRAATAASGSGSGCLDLLCPQSVQALRLPGGGGGSETPPLQQLLLQQPAGSADGGSSSSLAELQLADGSSLQCRLVVAADGARSRVRQLAGFRTVGWSYSQRGLVATVATSEPNDTAWQRFLPSGPLALLPVRGGYSNVVWTVTPEMARQLEGYSSSQFADAVNAALQPDPASFAVSSSSSSAGAGFSAAAAAAGSVLQGVLSRAPVLGPVLGGVAAGPLAAEAGSFWRQPPLVQGWVGSSPKSFPLQLQHSGR